MWLQKEAPYPPYGLEASRPRSPTRAPGVLTAAAGLGLGVPGSAVVRNLGRHWTGNRFQILSQQAACGDGHPIRPRRKWAQRSK